MMRPLLIAVALLLAGLPATAQPDSTARPAMDGIFEAFKTHPLVGLGETHRRAQELDFYLALIRDPRFARDVGNVVVEFGGAIHQDIIDRYVAGENVPYLELRKVWTDTVGWIGVVPAIGYQNFYAQVREVNLTLPPQNRIHVWAGEPVIDWSKIQTHADWTKLDRLRDSHPAELVTREILGHGKKALIIYGAGHFWPSVTGALGTKLDGAGWRPYTLRGLIDRDHAGALFWARFYNGAGEKSCIEKFEHKTSDAWPVPALVPLRGSAIADALDRCNPLKVENTNYPPGLSDAEKRQAAAVWSDPADALLYVGPRASLTFAPSQSDYFLDLDYFREIARRYQIQTEQPLPPPKISETPSSPRYVNH